MQTGVDETSDLRYFRLWASFEELKSNALSFHALDFFKFDVPAGGFDVVYDYT